MTFEKDKNYYYIEGVMTEEEFKDIVSDLNF